MDLTKLDLRPYREYKISDVMKIKGKLGFRVTLVYDDGMSTFRFFFKINGDEKSE